MNRLKQMVQDKRLHSLLLFIFLGLIVWFGGPYLAIAGHSFLTNSNYRLVGILILALLWGLNNLRLIAKPSAPSGEASLKQNFDRVSQLITSQTSSYLILSFPQSEKTTLLSQLSAKSIASFPHSEWWLTKNRVFIDSLENTDLMWSDFLNLLKQKSNLFSLNGIIVLLDLIQVLSYPKPQQQSIFQKIHQQLQIATSHYKNLSIYIVLTRCDSITGFTDFFADLDAEERKQIFGISFFDNDQSEISKAFELQYNNLLKRLNERLIGRLHQERSQQTRNRIKDFPLQLEFLKSTIEGLAKQFSTITHTNLKGIYFTSSLQHTNFFIEELFNQIIAADIKHLPFNKTPLRWATASAFVLIAIISLLWYRSYVHNINIIKNLQTEIAITKTQKITNDQYDFLPTINALYIALQQLRGHQSPQVEQLKSTASNTYQQILLTQFKPALQNIIETSVQNIKPQNPSDLYSALKVYLMLSEPNVRDINFIKQWFANYWQQTLPNNSQQQAQLNTQLAVLLQDPNFAITASTYIINGARYQLNQIPFPQLSFSVLLDRFHQPTKLFNPNDIITIKNQYYIQIIYTTALFNQIYNREILKACQEVLNGNWILGEKSVDTDVSIDTLVAQVQALYLQEYARAWTQLLNSVNFNEFQNLQQATQTLKILSSPNSPFLELLNTISINTAFNPATPQFNTVVSSQFHALNIFTQSPAVENLQTTLINLKKYFSKITNAVKPDKAVYNAAVARMENDNNDILEKLFQQLPNLPQPIQSWIAPIAVNGWQILLNGAQIYLNKIWANDVLPQYNAELDNRYPLFKNSNKEISISDFATFFAPGGIIDSFFNNYLKSFVDTSTYYWTFKKIDDQSINIPPTTLEMFIRASLIQKMFFSDTTNKPLVKFSLTPLAVEPGVMDFNLDLDGQIIDYRGGAATTTHLIWPGPVPNNVIMQFVNTAGKQTEISEQGFWAWFRLLDKANLETIITDPKQFKVTFDLNGNSVKYQLLADDLINPFIPGIIDVFRCPQKL